MDFYDLRIRPTCVVLSIMAMLMTPACALSQNAESPIVDKWPLYSQEDLNIDSSRLVPHRLMYYGDGGKAGHYAHLFRKAQISILFERIMFFEDEKSVDAFRIRWGANNHPNIDQTIAYADTFSVRHVIAAVGPAREGIKTVVRHVLPGESRSVLATPDADPQLRTISLQHAHHYNIVVLPYLFASMNVPDGAAFSLTGIGGAGEGKIDVDVTGLSTFIDLDGHEQKAYHVVSHHSFVDIDWYLDRENPPYLKRAVWHFKTGSLAGSSSINEPISWSVFDKDVVAEIVE